MLKLEWSKGTFTLYTKDNLPLGQTVYKSDEGFKFIPFAITPKLCKAFMELESHLPRFNDVEALHYIILGLYQELEE